jgi:hypothetical protein
MFSATGHVHVQLFVAIHSTATDCGNLLRPTVKNTIPSAVRRDGTLCLIPKPVNRGARRGAVAEPSESGAIQHFQKLAARSHVDGLCGEVARAVVDERLWDAVNNESIVRLASRIEQHRVVHSMLVEV